MNVNSMMKHYTDAKQDPLYLRIEEAKRQLKKHPEWSNDTIAEHCGFSSRNYFQTIFKKQTGVSPSEFS